MADAEESARKAVELFHAYHVQIFLQSVGQAANRLHEALEQIKSSGHELPTLPHLEPARYKEERRSEAEEDNDEDDRETGAETSPSEPSAPGVQTFADLQALLMPAENSSANGADTALAALTTPRGTQESAWEAGIAADERQMKAKQSGSVTHPSPAASKAIGSAGEVTSAHGEPGIYTLSSDGAPSKAEKAADILASCKASGSVAAPSTPAVRYTLSPDMLSTPTSKRKRPAPASESPPEVQARPTGKRKRHVRVLEGKKLPEQALAKGIASTPPKNIHRIRAAALAAAVAAVTAAEDEERTASTEQGAAASVDAGEEQTSKGSGMVRLVSLGSWTEHEKRELVHMVHQMNPCGASEWEALAVKLGRGGRGGASAERMYRTLTDPTYHKSNNPHGRRLNPRKGSTPMHVMATYALQKLPNNEGNLSKIGELITNNSFFAKELDWSPRPGTKTYPRWKDALVGCFKPGRYPHLLKTDRKHDGLTVYRLEQSKLKNMYTSSAHAEAFESP